MYCIPLKSDVEDLPRSNLDINSLLLAEYAYVVSTAVQAHEDRARLSVFFIASIGGLIGGLLSIADKGMLTVEHRSLLAIFFLLLSVWGAIIIVKLARLRVAWFSSARAQNEIKAKYCEFNGTSIAVFPWNHSTMPALVNYLSISFLLALQVAIFDSALGGVGVFLLGGSLSSSLAAALCGILLQVLLYRVALTPGYSKWSD